MNKYRVKFSHIVTSSISNQTNPSIKIVNVDEVYQVKPHVNIFEFIYSNFNVVGSVTIIELNDEQYL